jgi:hypothetical protein
MSGGGGEYTAGYRYFFGIHMGVCRGPVDEVLEARVGDRTAWFGSVTQTQLVYVDSPNLFGGEDKEGGVQGDMWVLMGDDAQLAPDALANITSGSSGGGSGAPGSDSALPNIVFPTDLFLNPTGGVAEFTLNTNGTSTPTSLNWYNGAPVIGTITDDYEVKFDVLSGAFGPITLTGTFGTWLPMTAPQTVSALFESLPSGNPHYRRIGVTFRKGAIESAQKIIWLYLEEVWTNPGGA